MHRRHLLGAAATLGAGALGARWLLPPARRRELASVPELAARIVDGLGPEERDAACVPYDHPLRQLHNRGVWTGGLSVRPWTLPRGVRQDLSDLLYAGLSEAGRARVPAEFFLRWPGVHALDLLVCGDPRRPPFQVILSGPHLNLRLGGTSREGVAFGGPQVYGDQRGDGRAGLPGNLYRGQLELASALRASLTPDARRRSLLETAPVQTQIEVQGRAGVFLGTPVAGMGEESRHLVQRFVDDVLSTYPAGDADYARACIEHNGGLAALWAAWFADGEVDGSGVYQTSASRAPAPCCTSAALRTSTPS